MAKKGAPKQDGIVAAIVLAVSNSRLKIKADRSTLNSVISGQYRDLVKDGTLRLPILWALLKDLPGFEKEDAKSAFCVLDSWATDFAMQVEMPKELVSMNDDERSQAAARCNISDSKKKQALFPEAVSKAKSRANTAPPGARTSSTISKFKQKDEPREGVSKGLISLLVAAVLIGGGVTAYTLLSGDKNAVSLDQFSSELPIKSASREGARLNLRLTSDDWFSEPDGQRKAQLDATLRSATQIEIDTVMVFDSIGNFRASAAWFGNQGAMRLRLKD